MSTPINFPLFRKYSHDRTYFKILSEEAFVQIDIVGDGFMVHTFRAKIYPDRVMIKDMINLENDAWEEIEEEQFEERMDYCRKNLREI